MLDRLQFMELAFVLSSVVLHSFPTQGRPYLDYTV
uniref:Uncharacterized protein n=1 Tax=Arundo donax TaxID=35708 RepID=A0A0A9EI47_ARUDO